MNRGLGCNAFAFCVEKHDAVETGLFLDAGTKEAHPTGDGKEFTLDIKGREGGDGRCGCWTSILSKNSGMKACTHEYVWHQWAVTGVGGDSNEEGGGKDCFDLLNGCCDRAVEYVIGVWK